MRNYDRRLTEESAYIIAEMSGNHCGSLVKALDIVRAAADAGADCLKIQTYTADTITLDCDKDYFVVRGGLWGGKRLYDLYREAFTPWEWTEAIVTECDKRGIDFMSTPFDFSSVEFLEGFGVWSYKIASPELIDLPLLRFVASKGKTMFVSTGMAGVDEVADAVDTMRSEGLEDFWLLQCCSQYPADCSNLNLSLLPDMHQRFGCRVGLSDHSPGSIGPVVAVALGARVVEKHLCTSRDDNSADATFSMEPDEFAKMVGDVRDAERALGTPSYGPSTGEARGIRNRRSLFAVADIARGEVLTPENVRSIRPGQGLRPKEYDRVIGRVASTDIERGTPLSWDFIAGGEDPCT